MKPWDELTIIRNRYRVRDLRLFRSAVETYYRHTDDLADELPVDWQAVQEARAQINRMLPRITQVVEAAQLGAAPSTGQPGVAVGRPDALRHIFTDRYVRSGGQEVLDVIDMAIGVYEASLGSALGRTINPLFYVGAVLNYGLGLPRRFFVALGFGGPSRFARARTAEIERLEAVAARLAETEETMESRFEELRERQQRQLAQHAQELIDLAERLDFTERVLAQHRAARDRTPPDPAPSPKS